jgi:hypothetical protein
MSDGQLTPSDIAQLAGVSRGAVSNWRARNPDFPEAVAGTAGKPLFDRTQVELWLRQHGYELQDAAALRVWSALNSSRGSLAMDDLVYEAHRLLAVRALAEIEPDATRAWEDIAGRRDPKNFDHEVRRLLAKYVPGFIADSDARPRAQNFYQDAIVRMIDPIAAIASPDVAYASDLMLERAGAAGGRAGKGEGLVDSIVSRILSAAVTSTPRTLYDPACGIAQALITIARRDVGGGRFVGDEVNGTILNIAAIRGLLHGVRLDLTLADTLRESRHPDLRADVIVAEPPIGTSWSTDVALSDPRWRFGVPPKTHAEFAWLQHVLAHLAPEGRGYVITAMGPLFRGGAEERIRSEMIRHDVVRAIVGLPGKLLPNVSIPLALWVVGNPRTTDAPGVLIINASTKLPDEIVEGIGLWLDGGPVEAPHAFVAREDLLGSDAQLTPARWTITPDIGLEAADISAAMEGLREARRALQELAPVAETDLPPESRVLRVGELVEHGLLRQRAGRLAAKSDDPTPGLVTPRHVREGLPDPVAVSDPAGSELPTSPGDVLVTTMSTVRARVDRAGGHVPARGVHVLTPDQSMLDPEYLAECVAANWNDALQKGTTITQASIKDLEIPMVPIETQRHIAAQLRRYAHAAATAEGFRVANEHAAAQLLAAARFGVQK